VSKSTRPKHSIEDVILQRDGRGIAALRPYLPDDFCLRAARLLVDRPGRVLIVTGFYEIEPSAIETDGPPGALALGRALQRLGRSVTHVSDAFGVSIL